MDRDKKFAVVSGLALGSILLTALLSKSEAEKPAVSTPAVPPQYTVTKTPTRTVVKTSAPQVKTSKPAVPPQYTVTKTPTRTVYTKTLYSAPTYVNTFPPIPPMTTYVVDFVFEKLTNNNTINDRNCRVQLSDALSQYPMVGYVVWDGTTNGHITTYWTQPPPYQVILDIGGFGNGIGGIFQYVASKGFESGILGCNALLAYGARYKGSPSGFLSDYLPKANIEKIYMYTPPPPLTNVVQNIKTVIPLQTFNLNPGGCIYNVTQYYNYMPFTGDLYYAITGNNANWVVKELGIPPSSGQWGLTFRVSGIGILYGVPQGTPIALITPTCNMLQTGSATVHIQMYAVQRPYKTLLPLTTTNTLNTTLYEGTAPGNGKLIVYGWNASPILTINDQTYTAKTSCSNNSSPAVFNVNSGDRIKLSLGDPTCGTVYRAYLTFLPS